MTEIAPEIFSGFVSSGGEEIYFESVGEGETVLFCHGLGGNCAHEDLRRLTMPILCIVGSEDRLILPAWVREIATILPHAQVVKIPGMGHSPYFEDAAAWNRIVFDFLQKC